MCRDSHEGPRVLVIEDDASTRQMMRRLLEKWGFTPSVASTLREAQAKLDGARIVLLDLNLPDGPGTDLLRLIRAGGKPVSVALTSGDEAAMAMTQDPTLRPDAVFMKPLDFDRLLSWLRAAASNHAPTSDEAESA